MHMGVFRGHCSRAGQNNMIWKTTTFDHMGTWTRANTENTIQCGYPESRTQLPLLICQKESIPMATPWERLKVVDWSVVERSRMRSES